MRLIALVATAALLSACGEKEEDIACCAIEPKAKCESELLGAGMTREEIALVSSSARVCPSDKLSAERIRELDAAWPAACRQSGMMSPAYAISTGQCESTSASAGISLNDLIPPEGIDAQKWTACGTGLKARGLTDAELWVMLSAANYACPNVGVDETRIRAIIDNHWDQAGCTQSTKAQMLNALETGACGGDAG